MIHTDRLDHIAAHGTGRLPRKIRLTDDAVISIHAGPGAYCAPRPTHYGLGNAPEDYPGPYTALEVYLIEPLTAPETWHAYNDDEEGRFFGYVPVDLVRALVVEHGGEHVAQDLADDAMKALADGWSAS